MKIKIVATLALLVAVLDLSGCVVVPNHGYGYGNGYGYGGPAVVVRPGPVIIDSGPYWGYRHWRRW